MNVFIMIYMHGITTFLGRGRIWGKKKITFFFRGKEWEEQYTESQGFIYKPPCIGRMIAFSEMCREVKLSEACKSQLHGPASTEFYRAPPTGQSGDLSGGRASYSLSTLTPKTRATQEASLLL